MKKPTIPENEERRLEVLRSYRILDTDPEKEFDHLIEVAAHIAGTPISFISLVDADRQWFKSKKGFSDEQTDRDTSLCGHVVGDDQRLTVSDLAEDERFSDNPVVQERLNLRFYSGTPLRVDDTVIGTLCVADNKPHDLSDEQLRMLDALAETTMRLIQARSDAKLLSRSEHLARTIHEFTLHEPDLRKLLDGFIEIGCDRFEADLGFVTQYDQDGILVDGMAAPTNFDITSANELSRRTEDAPKFAVERRLRERYPDMEWGSMIQVAVSTGNGFDGTMTLLREAEMEFPLSDLDKEELLMLAKALEAEIHKILDDRAKRQLFEELEERLAHIKTLHGLIPICSYCKQIRDDEGAWQAVERYVMSRSDAEFSHSICPCCYDDHFGDDSQVS